MQPTLSLHYILKLKHQSSTYQFLDGVWSEVSLYHEDDLRWFLNTDETHHTFSTASKKGGSTTQSYANNSFPRSGEPVIENSRHTTGVYTTNAAGEVLPPLYIFDSKAQDKLNYKIELRVSDGLPTVTCRYGLDREINIWFVCGSPEEGIHGHESMDAVQQRYNHALLSKHCKQSGPLPHHQENLERTSDYED